MFKKSRKMVAVLISVFLLVGILAACDGGSSDDIVIGVLVPTSGTEAYYGTDMMQSYDLAVSEINEAGGVLGKKLKLFQADDGCDPNMASTAASRIVAEGVDFVVGGYCSGATIPAMQQFYDANLLFLLSGANSTRITEQGFQQSFMINSPGSHAVLTLIDLLKYVGAQNVALIHQADEYTENLSDLCQAGLPPAGFNIVAVEVMEKGAADVSAIVTSIQNSGADFVYWCGYHADGSNVIRQLRRGGFEGHIAVGDGSASPELITAAGPEGEGVFVTSPPFVEFAVGGEAFVSAYRAHHKMAADDDSFPGAYATLAYDTIYLLKAAIEKAGSFETAAVRNAVQSIEFQGLSGLIKFTADREPALSNFIILQIENGAFKKITP
ncbi:MAG: branched-chain amino acid ABC transporter substrate-binding protein [Oscillospiraceae bacterium]|nr:branched-chain amino acid ABC transporter substrate-binding protein [Oscillospiraceae bacterium]